MHNISLNEVTPDKDKLSRALPWASRARAGKVFARRARWNQDFLDEACSFNGESGGRDDQVDAVSQGYHWLSGMSGNFSAMML